MKIVKLTGSNGSPNIGITTTSSIGNLLYTEDENYISQILLEASVNSTNEHEIVLEISGAQYGFEEVQRIFVNPRNNTEITSGKILLSPNESIYAYSPTSTNDNVSVKGYVNKLTQSQEQQSEQTGSISSLLDLDEDCIAYWRADLEVSHSSGSLTLWKDQSGFGNDLIPTNGSTCDANQEASFEPLNNQPVVAFSGSSSEGMWKQNSTGSNDLTELSFVCVLDPGEGSFDFAPGILLYRNGISGATTDEVGFIFAESAIRPAFVIKSNNENVFNSQIDEITGSLWIFGRWSSTTGDVEFWTNSILISQSFNITSSISNNLNFLLNIRNNAVDTVASGKIAEAAVFSSYLSNNSLKDMTNYFETRYNIVSGSIPT